MAPGVAATFRSPSRGSVHALVADHVVQGRIIFPAAAHLEVARGASAAAMSSVHTRQLDIAFIQPLAISSNEELAVECTTSGASFEVCSGTEAGGSLMDMSVHCSGNMCACTEIDEPKSMGDRREVRIHARHVGMLYDNLQRAGLQYGPGFRTLLCVWNYASCVGIARLSPSQGNLYTNGVPPAQLDGALQLSLLTSNASSMQMRLPFAVRSAQLQVALGNYWAVSACSLQNVSVLFGLTGARSSLRLWSGKGWIITLYV